MKPIPGFDKYFADEAGTIYSGKGRSVKPMKARRNVHGYWSLDLYRDGERVSCRVHQLILITFVGPKPPKMDGCHNDGNKDNNALSNLRWDTRKGNEQDKLGHGTRMRGEDCSYSKLTNAEVVDLKSRWASGEMQKDIAGDLRVSRSLVCQIINGQKRQYSI